MNYKSFFVKSDYSYKGDFQNYNSFYLISGDVKTNADNSKEADNSGNTIEQLINYQMELHGYQMKASNPSLLVSYHIFNDKIKLRGYDQQDLMYWIKNKGDQEYDPITYKLPEGTLIIQFIDTKQDQIIWQGYVSGLLPENDLYSSRDLKRAVFLIFDRYRTFASGYLADQNLQN
jgi:hypothetical protein